MGKILDGYPYWTQQDDPDSTGRQDQFSTQDCGWEACSIVIKGLLGEVTNEGDLRREDPTAVSHGTTVGAQLVACLARHRVTAVRHTMFPLPARAAIKVGIDNGFPSVYLGFWVAPTVLHWIVCLGYGNDSLVYMDPWDGQLKAMRWNVVASKAFGEVVGVRATI